MLEIFQRPTTTTIGSTANVRFDGFAVRVALYYCYILRAIVVVVKANGLENHFGPVWDGTKTGKFEAIERGEFLPTLAK